MALTMQLMVRASNRWRDSYNPLRGLTITRIVELLEQGQCGCFGELQWLYFFIERRDATLRAVIARRRAALLKLDWEIKTVAELPEGATESQAAAQKKTLRAAYDRIDNLKEAIKWLGLAEFRGFTHLQKQTALDVEQGKILKAQRAGEYSALEANLAFSEAAMRLDGGNEITHLEPIPQWQWCRDGLYGPWAYNPTAAAASFSALNKSVIDPANFLIRECDLPINEIALICRQRKDLSQKDWDAFVEIYGIPHWIVIGPPNVPLEKETEYRDAAGVIAEGGSGYLPNGSDAKAADTPRGTSPFKEHIDYQDQQIVLAGTGGKLTMLAGPVGLGGGQADVHQDVFNDIAQAEAFEISEVFQKQFDAEILEREHSGEPVLAYFELCAKDEADVDSLADQAVKWSQAGLSVDPAEMSEKAGYALTPAAATSANPNEANPGTLPRGDEGNPNADAPGQIANRNRSTQLPTLNPQPGADLGISPLLQNVRSPFATAVKEDLQPLANRVLAILDIADPELFNRKARELVADLPQLLHDVNADPASERLLYEASVAALLNGLTAREEAQPA